MKRSSCVLWWLLACMGATGASPGAEAPLARSGEKAVLCLPDFGAEVRTFDAPEKRPVAWWPHVVNAAWGGGSGGPERNGGWLDAHWELVDYLDRSGDYSTHDYLSNRGIWYEVYGSNEYQETIHFHEEGARKLLWDDGIARDMSGGRVLSEDFNMGVKWWAEQVGWDAFIGCNNAPRWSAIIDYDWLASPLLGFAISQDNIGGPLSRIGAGGHGRYCDFCSAKFFHHLEATGRLPEFRSRYRHIRDYVQENLMDVVRRLSPHAPWRGNADEAALLARLCEPPVMAEYQKFLFLSHLDNFIRYYRDAKLVAERRGVEYDVHGNQGGFFVGADPYQVALADFVDTVWFESSGISTYEIFQHGWNNSAGPFRYQMGQAMTRGRKPFMSMTAFHKHTPDLVEHEMAEACAGGGVLFVDQHAFEKEPGLLAKMTEYFRFRHAHRALYASTGRRSDAEIALVYSIPTMMYRSYQYSADAAPHNALFGMARALEEGHLPFDVVIFNHPEIHADAVTIEGLKRYRLVILPALECLSRGQIDLLARYLGAGGTLGLLGDCGMRDEDNRPLARPPAETWRKAGRTVSILPPGKSFLPVRALESDETRLLTRTAIESVSGALGGDAPLAGNLPRLLWIKTWIHEDDFASWHLVNYDIDFASGDARPTPPLNLTVTLPRGVAAEEAVWLVPDGTSGPVAMAVRDAKVQVKLPPVRVHGVLVIGRRDREKVRSAKLQGDALLTRAGVACGGRWDRLGEEAAAVQAEGRRLAAGPSTVEAAASYAQAANRLLRACQAMRDEDYRAAVRRSAAADGTVLALAFGATGTQGPWKAVSPNAAYSAETGFGWIPGTDDSEPTPEETYYAGARRYGGKIAAEVTPGRLLFWPYREPAPAPLRTNLACGGPRRFRADVPPGQYVVRVVTTNPSWSNGNFFVSGMVSVNGAVSLLDAPADHGSLVDRRFPVSTDDGKLDFTFGGPTGWGIAALVIAPGEMPGPDPQAAGGLRRWSFSPRYANPDWHPIDQVRFSPEGHLTRLPDADWKPVQAPPSGLPVVDLGSDREAEVGDVVYGATVIETSAPREAVLHFGASSQARLWLNGRPIGSVPNEKGLRRDELVVPLSLERGRNVLAVKLERFWERRWMSYASLTDR